MATSINFTFDANFDLDSLFTFNYNFDRLKAVIEILLQNQKGSNQKFEDIHTIIETKNKKITNLEKEVQSLSNQIRGMNKILLEIQRENKKTKMNKREETMKIIEKENEEEEEIVENNEENETEDKENKVETRDIIKNKRQSVKNVRDSMKINENLNLETQNEEERMDNLNQTKDKSSEKIPFEFDEKDQKENLNNLIRRVMFLESQIKNTVILNENMSEIKKKINEHEDDIRTDNQSIKKIIDRINYHDTQIDDLKNKIADTSMTDILNRNISSNEGGEATDNKRFELIVGLIKNLENKINQNSSQGKKLEEDLKQTKTDVSNVKSNVDESNLQIDLNKEKIETIMRNFTKIEGRIDKHEDALKNLTDQLNKYKNENELKIENIMIALKNLETISSLNSKEDLPVQQGDMNESDMKIIKDLQKKIADVEKNYKILISTINLDPIYKEISKINENIATKLGQHDLNEMRNNNSKYKIFYNQIGQLLLQINYIKDLISQLQDDKNSNSLELTRLKKKIDNLNSNLSLISKSNNEADANSNQTLKVVQLDHNKYVDIATFIDFKNNITKDIDSIEFTLSDIKKLIEEILLQLKAKINDTDLKNLEEYLLTKIEEFRTGFARKFADKLETSKNFKYLDQQIKHVIDVYIKRMEKGDNWLLAKKPLEGFACASCESYIGDLKENNAYIPWNKYPMRDPNDKLYRMGNGFSKMLQMINIENNPKNFQTSAEFFVKSQEHLEADQKKKNVLPKLKLKVKKNPGNMSADDIEEVDDYENIQEMETVQEPKM